MFCFFFTADYIHRCGWGFNRLLRSSIVRNSDVPPVRLKDTTKCLRSVVAEKSLRNVFLSPVLIQQKPATAHPSAGSVILRMIKNRLFFEILYHCPNFRGNSDFCITRSLPVMLCRCASCDAILTFCVPRKFCPSLKQTYFGKRIVMQKCTTFRVVARRFSVRYPHSF